MNNKFLIGILVIIMVTGCNLRSSIQSGDNTTYDTSSEVVSSLRAVIDGEEYTVNLEDNETVKNFISMLPYEFNMSELNGNEKYVYLDKSLPVNSTIPERINAGDMMLYGDNCLVLFYKSFDTSYSYTKIGHIDNLPDLGSENISLKVG